MGPQSSKENVVTENMIQDESESFNVVNIHSPTANLGLSVLFGLVAVYIVFKLYCRFTPRCSRGRKSPREKQEPVPSSKSNTTSVDMSCSPAQTTVGVDDRCQDCLVTARLERAWAQEEQDRRQWRVYGGGYQAGVGDDSRASRGRRVSSRSPPRRRRSVESF